MNGFQGFIQDFFLGGGGGDFFRIACGYIGHREGRVRVKFGGGGVILI